MKLSRLFTLILLVFSLMPAAALPVKVGEVEIGLESFDGYQEGTAFLSTNEEGTQLEIFIAYRGFGLDTVTWTFSGEDVMSLRDSTAQAAWWRSRLLEITINQNVSRDMTSTVPLLVYAYRSHIYPFDSSDHIIRFVRQGKDYALIITEDSPGADTRRSGEKTLPVFTVHLAGSVLPELRDLISEENMVRIIEEYAVEKAAIESILESSG
ncbi:MAG: hypothetical protein RQ801_07270 [Spirochaetaceae bacterium]|nr:hypothetical protein [Spirochaetaceae bacterium]MDT8298082.1 hypothetical protein [Spirochaetaceae bacterium]